MSGQAVGRRRTVLIASVVVLGCLVLAGVVAYYASPHPDGLEYVAHEQGFAQDAQNSPTAGSPLAHYGVSGVQEERLSVGLAGAAGVALTAVLGFGLFLLVRAGRDQRGADASGAERTGASGG